MKKSTVIGKRITDVVQERRTGMNGKPVWVVTQLVLNGKERLILQVVECWPKEASATCHAIDAFVTKLSYLKRKPGGFRP